MVHMNMVFTLDGRIMFAVGDEIWCSIYSLLYALRKLFEYLKWNIVQGY